MQRTKSRRGLLGRLLIVAAAAWLTACSGGEPVATQVVHESAVKQHVVTGVPPDVRQQLGLTSFYVRYVDVGGLAIVGSARTQDVALLEAAYVIDHMLARRRDVLSALRDARIRFAVIAPDELLTDLPEYAALWPQPYWNGRARGVGPSDDHRAASAGEENVLGYRGDLWVGESLTIHELSHAIQRYALAAVDPTFDTRLADAYAAALEADRWTGTYAGANPDEYWAEGAQSWFDANVENDTQHNAVNTRDELRAYDPPLAALLAEVFGDDPWRLVDARLRRGVDHLAGFDATRFSFDAGLRPVDIAEDAAIPPLVVEPASRMQPSIAGGPSAGIFFANRSAAVVGVDWVEFDGRRRHVAWLLPNADLPVQTSAGEVWALKDGAGNPTGVILASSFGKAVLR